MVNCNIQSDKMASLLDSNLNYGDKDELSSELKYRDKAEIHNVDFLDSSLHYFGGKYFKYNYSNK